MNTIVMNTLNGAVTEYAGFGFQSITSTHAGSATGLFALGGDKDVTARIQARVQTGKREWGTSLKLFIGKVFLALRSSGTLKFHVETRSAAYDYPVVVAASGQSSAKPGRGIRENYLSFGLSNPGGQAFFLDAIEIPEFPSKSRRV